MQELVRYRSLVWAFAQRDLKSRYRSSVLGWTWSLVIPISMLLLYALVWGELFRIGAPPMGDGRAPVFVLFLFCGLFLWNGFQSVVMSSMGSIRGAGELLRKVYFPPFAPVLGGSVAVIVQMLIEGAVLLGASAVVGNIGWTWLYLFLIVPLAIVFAQGLGLFVAALSAAYGDVQYVMAVVMQAWFFLTPVLYPITLVPQHAFGLPLATLFRLNPMTWFVQGTHEAVYSLHAPSPGYLLGMFGAAVVTYAVGWVTFQRAAPNLSEML